MLNKQIEKLAIDGGRPIRDVMLPYARQHLDSSDRAAVDAVLQSDWLTTGPMVQSFEKSVTDFTSAKEAVAVNTGTAALHAAVWVAGISSEDEVIVPAISFVASANCVLYMGAKPVFADLCADTLNIDPADVRRKITSRTRAIIVVDYAGHPCDHDELKSISVEFGIPVIEDAAHSLGAIYKGKKVGTIQDLTTLSFHPVKHITTGEGGMVLTDDPIIAKRVRSFRHHGIDLDLHQRAQMQSWRYDIIALGYNYRIPDINCALGVNQMTKLEGWLQRRREIAKAYNDSFADIDAVECPTEHSDCSSAWHLYVLRLRLDQLTQNRDQVFSALRAENIGVNVNYIPIPWMSHYQSLGYGKGNWPVAEREFERIISLPMFPAMTNKDVEEVVAAVRKVIGTYLA